MELLNISCIFIFLVDIFFFVVLPLNFHLIICVFFNLEGEPGITLRLLFCDFDNHSSSHENLFGSRDKVASVNSL